MVSDGQHYQQAMLATQLNNIVTDQGIVVNSIIQLDEVMLCHVQHRK